MGPYYRGTSQATGHLLDSFYQHPILMLLLVVSFVGIGVYVWYKKN